jgi:hypothetical protein
VRLRDLVLTRPPGEARSAAAAALWTAIALVVTMALIPGALHARIEPAADAHAVASLNLALDDVLCAKPGYLSTRVSVGERLQTDPALADTAVRALPSQLLPSADYCASVTEPYLINEPLLMLLIDFVLRVAPHVTLRTLGTALVVLRIATWAAVTFVAAWCGASLMLAIAVMYIGLAVLHALHMELSVYPFLLVLPAAAAAVYAAAARSGIVRRAPAAPYAFALAAGALTAIAGSMRTSYLPIYVVFFGLWMGHTHRKRGADRRSSMAALLSIAAFGAGSIAMGAAIARAQPRRSVPSESNAYHAIAHPLVLGVATPVNAFAQRLGIEWDDATGLEIARRIDPGVSYLGPRYERALFRYYLQLWRTYPSEMLGLYWFKLNRTGRGLITALQRADIVAALRDDRARRLEAVWNGLVFIIPAIALSVACLWLGVTRDEPFSLLGGMLAAAAAAILIESALIMPTFTPMYHGYLLFAIVFLPVLAGQCLLDRAAAAVSLRWTPSRS